ncbi:MAG: 50S ribosomal protein L10 [Candidatus Zixiibacteriota bacterium]|nr:MAG: 50S ribosomal protein L10 [candidate division Zixibacteria bacterium]
MLKIEKKKTVDELREKFSLTTSLFLTDFRGLNVDQMTDLRRDLKEKKAEYRITKNTLIRLAAKEGRFEGILDYLEGPTGLVFSFEDPVSPAKVLYEIYRKIEKPKIKIIWMEGKLLRESQLKSLATLPSKEVILTQIVVGLNSPVATLVGTLQGVMRNLVGVLDAVREERSKAA